MTMLRTLPCGHLATQPKEMLHTTLQMVGMIMDGWRRGEKVGQVSERDKNCGRGRYRGKVSDTVSWKNLVSIIIG